MKATTIRTASVAIIVLATSFFSLNAQELIFSSVWENNQINSAIEYKRDTRGMYYKNQMAEYSYDESGRISEKKVYKWNSRKSTWVVDHKIVWSKKEADNNVAMEYHKWNAKENKFNASQKRITYQLNDCNSDFLYYASGNAKNDKEIVNMLKGDMVVLTDTTGR